MALKILPPVVGVRPSGVMQERLPPELVSDTQTLHRSKTGNALAPVGVLVLSRRLPIAIHEVANAASNHEVILLLTSYVPFWSMPTLDNRSASWFFSRGT